MKKISITHLLLLIWSVQLTGQIVDFDKFSSQILEANKGELFSNTSFVDSLIKDKRIILLGELDHGDGSSFEVKTRLIKYLHEKHHFNTLVFESGMINCNQLWEEAQSGSTILELAKKHIYYIWSEVKEMNDLYEYIDQQIEIETPLKIVGIDPQFSGRESYQVFIKMLEKKLDANELEDKKFKEFSHELEIISQWLKYPKTKDHRISEATFNAHLDYYKEKILSQIDNNEKELWTLYFENVEIFTTIKWKKKKDHLN